MDRAHDAIGAIADKGLDWFGRPTLERNLAVAFAKKIPLPGEDQIKVTVQAVRILGVFLCVGEGIDIIDYCPCFRKLAEDKSKDELKEILERKLNMLKTSAVSEHDEMRQPRQ